jgi:isopropylmalate/homocitrate/citramalate synthase
VLVSDVGPRDGLQNDPVTLSPARRAELCDRLARAGVQRIEAASFVNPKRVPQMAGAEDVLAQVDRSNGTEFAGLVLNERGYDRARESGLDHVEYAVPVTDTFAQRNQGVSLDEALGIGARVVARAREDGAHTGVTLSVAFGCPFEGPVGTATVARVAEQVAAWEPDELALADTIGVGVPTQVRELVGAVSPLAIPVRGHFHNTRNTGYANAVAALEAGVEILDASVGGTGGCPFAPNATGNIASEDLVYLLHGMGVETAVDLDALIDTANWLHDELDHELPGMLRRAGPFPEEHRGGRRNGS